MRRENVSSDAVCAAGVQVTEQVTDDELIYGLYDQLDDGVLATVSEQCITIAGEELNVVITENNVFVFFCEYVLEDGVETDEVDLAMCNIFKR